MLDQEKELPDGTTITLVQQSARKWEVACWDRNHISVWVREFPKHIMALNEYNRHNGV